MSTLATLRVALLADARQFHGEMSRAETRTRKFASGVQSIGKAAILGSLAAVGAGVAGVVGVMKATVPVAREFESSLVDLEIAASESGKGLGELKDMALAVGGDTGLLGVSASGAADSMTGLYKAGLSTTEIFGDLQGYMAGTAELGGALRASIDLAAATEMDMVQASDLAAVSLATFGGGLETAEERAEFVNMAMNNMVQAADASVAEVGDLAQALVNIGPTASAMGIGIQNTNNALAILSTRGIKGSEAGTALKSMLTNLQRQTPAVTDALGELNVSLYDAQGAFVGMPNLVGQLETALSDMTDEQRTQYIQTIAGTYGMNAMNALLETGTVGWNKMADATANATDMQAQALAKANSLEGVMEALGGIVETVKIKIGDSFIPVLKEMGKGFMELIEKVGPAVTDWFENVLAPAMMAAGQGLFTFVGALMDGKGFFEGFALGLESLGFGPLAEKVRVFKEQLWALWEVVLPYLQTAWEWIAQTVEMNDVWIALGIAVATVVVPAVWGLLAPILSFVAIAAVVVGAITLIRTAWENDWGGIRTWMVGFWNSTLQPMFVKLKAWLGVYVPEAINRLAIFWNDVLAPALENVWAFLSSYVFPLFKAVYDFVKTAFSVEIVILAGIWQTILKPALEAVWNYISQQFLPGLKTLHGFWVDTLKPAFKKLDFLRSIKMQFDGITSAIRWATEKLETLRSKLLTFELPDWLQRHSPSPFEMTFLGAGEAIRDLARIKLPELKMSLGAVPEFPDFTLAAGDAVGGQRPVSGDRQDMVVYGGLNLNGVNNQSDLLEELKRLM